MCLVIFTHRMVEKTHKRVEKSLLGEKWIYVRGKANSIEYGLQGKTERGM